MRALVTGGCGFIGAALVRELLDATTAQILVLDDLSVGSTSKLPGDDRVRFARVDVRDAAQIAGALVDFGRVDQVYHLAALHFVPACERDPAACHASVVGGTRSLLGALDAHGAPDRFFLASSAAVYGSGERLHAEGDALRPTTAYGAAKARAEDLVQRWAARREGGRVAIGRYANAWGAGDTHPHVIPALIAQLASGALSLRMARGDAERDFVHVADLARGTRAMLRHASASQFEVLNLGSGRLCSVARLVELAQAAVGRPLEVTWSESRWRRHEPRRLGLDPARAQSVLGWRALEQLEPGIARLLSAPKEVLEFVRWESAG